MHRLDRIRTDARRSRAQDEDALAVSLFMGQSDRVSELFYAAHARPPLVRWSPNRIDLQSDLFEDFLADCWALPARGGLPEARAFDPERMRHRRWIAVCEPEGFGRDFRYLHFGQRIAEYRDRGLEGRRTSDIAGHVGQFFVALYRAAMHRRQIVLTEHEPEPASFVRLWRRLVVPLVDDGGYVARFAVMALPENQLRAGLEVVPFPCIVADSERVIRLANGAARALAEDPAAWEHGRGLDEFLGHRLALPADPLALIEPVPRRVCERATLGLPGLCGRPTRVDAAAARFAGQALFVVTIGAPESAASASGPGLSPL